MHVAPRGPELLGREGGREGVGKEGKELVEDGGTPVSVRHRRGLARANAVSCSLSLSLPNRLTLKASPLCFAASLDKSTKKLPFAPVSGFYFEPGRI